MPARKRVTGVMPGRGMGTGRQPGPARTISSATRLVPMFRQIFAREAGPVIIPTGYNNALVASVGAGGGMGRSYSGISSGGAGAGGGTAVYVIPLYGASLILNVVAVGLGGTFWNTNGGDTIITVGSLVLTGGGGRAGTADGGAGGLGGLATGGLFNFSGGNGGNGETSGTPRGAGGGGAGGTQGAGGRGAHANAGNWEPGLAGTNDGGAGGFSGNAGQPSLYAFQAGGGAGLGGASGSPTWLLDVTGRLVRYPMQATPSILGFALNTGGIGYVDGNGFARGGAGGDWGGGAGSIGGSWSSADPSPGGKGGGYVVLW